MTVEARDITYYKHSYYPKGLTEIDLVFYKPDVFKQEDEFRIALFYPLDKSNFKAENGDLIPIRNEDEPGHITISYPEKTFLKHFIGNVFKRNA